MRSSTILVFVMALSVPYFVFSNIVPVTQNNPTNDPYIGYQWSINNQGQTISQDIDDIHSIHLQSNPMTEIGWGPDLDSKFKKDVIVAVVDSGVDAEHEDLKGHIAINEKECVGGKISTSPTGDPDGNGFEGDCQGWSFVAPDKKRARLTDDEIGHGTHIAGIIAAGVNNGIGVSGLSNRIKILPLKVYDEKEERGSATRRESISDRVSQAIDYAVLRKADVINLSLGWPIINNSEKVKKSIESALAAGVVIVAGAGNDRHNAPIYPCAHPGVICVGSVNIDGAVSRFSNYGGQVDVLAPGGDIVSTWPMTKTFQEFGPKGYEVKSGTSQATPYVSGAVAILKAVYPGISNSEVRARLLLGAQKTAEGISTRGLINIKKSLDLTNTQMVIPSFKALDHVSFNVSTQEFTLPVTIQNLGPAAKTVSVKVRSQNAHIELLGSIQNVVLNADSTQTVNIKGKIKSLEADAFLKYEVAISGESFTHQIQLTRDLNSDPFTKILPIQTSESLENLNLSSVVMYGVRNVDTEYWSSEPVSGGFKIHIYRITSQELKEAGSFILPEVSGLLADISVLRVDANYDGRLDYFIGGIVRDEKENIKGLQYSYISSNFQELYGKSSHILLNFEGVIPSFKNLKFGQYLSKALGKIAVPVFFAEGPIPSADLNPDAFAFEQNGNAWRLYYFEPSEQEGYITFQTRSFFNSQSLKSMRKGLGLKSTDDLYNQALLPQPESDFNKGTVRVLSSSGVGIKRKYFVLNIEGVSLQNQEMSFTNADYQGLDLLRQVVDETLTLEGSEESVGASVDGIFSQTKARGIVLDRKASFAGVAEIMTFDIQDPFERVLGLIKTFELNGERLTFYEADTSLNVVGTHNGKALNVSGPIYRSSFLPGQFFTQRFFPLFIGEKSQKKAGLYVDNTNLFSPTILTWTLNRENELIAPLNLSFELPNECQAKNPARVDGRSMLALLCRSKGSMTLKLVGL